MMPRQNFTDTLVRHRNLLLLGLGVFCGCSPLLMRPQSPDELQAVVDEEESNIVTVGKLSSPRGMKYVKIESVALVTNLDGTGSDPRPSSRRNRLIAEMQTHEVKNPNQVLASPSTSMVIVRGFLPPGVQKGDRFDIEIIMPSRSESTSFRGGWLMRSRMRQMAVLGGQIRTGDVDALARGPVLVDSVFESDDDPTYLKRGRVLGGAIARRSRSLGLQVNSGSFSVRTTTMLSQAINSRFHTFDRGVKTGVAIPKNDRFIELSVHPRYKNNITRYMRVVGSIALRESVAERAARLLLLKRQLVEPTTAAITALRLEAIGKEAVEILKQTLSVDDSQVRFHAAEALAYMDQAEAAAVLTETAKNEPALRWHALSALAAMDHLEAYEGLSDLLHVDSAETRYGAFRALRVRNPSDPQVRGEPLKSHFGYHVIPTLGPPMVHFSRSHRTEIVVFDREQTMRSPGALFVGSSIMVKGLDENRIKVVRHGSGDQEDQQKICSTNLDEILRTVIEYGADYEQVLDFLRDAKRGDYLSGRLIIDALPSPWRRYHQRQEGGASEIATPSKSSPLPDMFHFHLDDAPKQSDNPPHEAGISDVGEYEQPSDGIFAKMKRWFSFTEQEP